MDEALRLLPDQTCPIIREGCNYVGTTKTRGYFNGMRAAGMPKA